MSEHDLPDLPSDVSALLDEARGVPSAPVSERRKVAARLAITTGLAIPSTTLAVSRAVSSAWLGKALGVALLAVGGLGVARVATRHEQPPHRAQSAHAPASQPIARPAPPATNAVAPTPSVTARAAPTAAPAPTLPTGAAGLARTAHRSPAPVDEDLSFRDELSLLERAHAALSGDDIDGATAALSQHARRFPHGRLEPEREALRVQCAAARGDREAASAARERFHRRFPDSVLGASVDRAVDGR